MKRTFEIECTDELGPEMNKILAGWLNADNLRTCLRNTKHYASWMIIAVREVAPPDTEETE